MELLLPSKGGDFEVSKLTCAQKTQVYTLDHVPLIVDTTGKNDFMPTIFALWRVPTLLPTIYVKHPAVSQYVIGANPTKLDQLPVLFRALPDSQHGSFRNHVPVITCSQAL